VYSLSISNVEILVALSDGEGSGPWDEFMAEDFCDEDVLGQEVLQLCSHAVIGWLDAPSGLFGLRSIQMASI
jgi:hypothetical protein